MGIRLIGAGSDYDTDYSGYGSLEKYNYEPPAPENKKCELVDSRDPDPCRFKITKHYQTENGIVVMVNYPNCTNYEGNKILVFMNTGISELSALDVLDPHFQEATEISPFARFEPTDKGWLTACKLVE